MDSLPIIKCWPDDGGRFITMGLTISESPKTSKRNMGMYRLQVHDKNTLGVHWHPHKGGAAHYHEACGLGVDFPIAVVLGGDPSLIFAAIAPLPDNQCNHLNSIVSNIAQCGSIVDFCIKSGTKNIIFFSSSAVYEKQIKKPFNEIITKPPTLMYATSKYLAEKYFDSVVKSYKIKERIYGQSHLSLITPPNDPYYGKRGIYKDCEHYPEKSKDFKACKN